ncbi:MAG TPA: GGDEF domain-containing protein [Thermoguttaceae bacterium]
MQNLFGLLDIWNFRFPLPVALAIMATIGYLVGRRGRKLSNELVQRSKRELQHAKSVAAELENIVWGIRKSLAKHHASVTRFKDRIGKLHDDQQESHWKNLCREAEDMLKPTMQLAAQIADAYDKIRQQSSHLMTITEVRSDPLTNVKNRRGLDDVLQTQFALMNRYDTPFSLVIFDIDHFKDVNDVQGHLQGDRALQDIARLLDEQVRETDIVARYGGDEFIVVMPHTDLDGARVLSERLRSNIQENMSITVSGGVASAMQEDTQDTLIARADSALYHAKTSGRNCVSLHDGTQITILAPQESLSEF